MGIIINADKEKIGQVLNNLLSNAIKYSPKGGNITISCKPIDGKVRIAVTDEGVGINKGDQKKLFDRFYRVKNEKVKTVSGFGIGLYLVSEIVRYHNSKIEVASTEDHGSTFYFDLDIKSR
jgi:signal transduction histidine kinase